VRDRGARGWLGRTEAGKPLGNSRWASWLAPLLAGALGVRVIALVASAPVRFPDTGGYVDLGRALLSLDLTRDVGMRTPVYSLFMAALGFNADAIRALQMLLGLTVTGLLFWAVWSLTKSGWLAALAGAAYGLNPGQVYLENSLLTESLCTFFLVVAVVLYARGTGKSLSARWAAYAGAGAAASLAALTRPALLLLPIVLVCAAWLGREGYRAVLVLAVAGLVPILAWSALNYTRFGYFTPTTMTGVQLTNLTGAYVEDAPDQYADIRAIYLEARKKQGGDHVDAIFKAYPEMMRVTGMSFPDLSNALQRMSVGLIVSHPAQYLRAVAWNFAEFWKGDHWATEPPPGTLWRLAHVAGWVVQGALILVSCAALVLAVVAEVRRRRTGIAAQAGDRVILVVLIVSVGSALMASATGFGSMNRYGMPIQSLAGMLLALGVFLAVSRQRSLVADRER
jgi:4-amino-4-deoxy-L-arabinose transferase-like glycosyltransferase